MILTANSADRAAVERYAAGTRYVRDRCARADISTWPPSCAETTVTRPFRRRLSRPRCCPARGSPARLLGADDGEVAVDEHVARPVDSDHVDPSDALSSYAFT